MDVRRLRVPKGVSESSVNVAHILSGVWALCVAESDDTPPWITRQMHSEPTSAMKRVAYAKLTHE